MKQKVIIIGTAVLLVAGAAVYAISSGICPGSCSASANAPAAAAE